MEREDREMLQMYREKVLDVNEERVKAAYLKILQNRGCSEAAIVFQALADKPTEVGSKLAQVLRTKRGIRKIMKENRLLKLQHQGHFDNDGIESKKTKITREVNDRQRERQRERNRERQRKRKLEVKGQHLDHFDNDGIIDTMAMDSNDALDKVEDGGGVDEVSSRKGMQKQKQKDVCANHAKFKQNTWNCLAPQSCRYRHKVVERPSSDKKVQRDRKDSHRVTQYKRKGKDRGKDNRTRGKIEVSRRKRWKGRIGKCYKCTVKRY